MLIEQAEGVLAARGAVSMAEAFDQLRGYARAHHQRITALASSVVDGSTDTCATGQAEVEAISPAGLRMR